MRPQKIKFSIGIVILLYSISCTPDPDIIFDREVWIEDFSGCSGQRRMIYKDILNQKKELMGVSSKKIIKTIGKPNINELYKRNQKFFVYQISPDRSCAMRGDSSQLYLILRFNAVGLVTELYVNDKSSPTD